MERPLLVIINNFAHYKHEVIGQIINLAADKAQVKPLFCTSEASINSEKQSASVLIADVTEGDSSVMYHVGMAHGEGKPVLLIADRTGFVPFSLAAMRILMYDLGSPIFKEDLANRLAELIEEALTRPEAFLMPEISAERAKRQNIFISYSHEDREYLDRLLVHLKPLEKQGLIDLWVDSRLRPGDRWKTEIEQALNKATVAILLVSADFLASDFITENELPPILVKAEEKGTRIIPVIVKPCRFARDNELRHFHAINDPKESVMRMTAGKQEKLYDQLTEEIEKLVQKSDF